MTEIDDRIRGLVRELGEAAPPPPQLGEARTPRHRLSAVAVFAVALVVVLVAGTASWLTTARRRTTVQSIRGAANNTLVYVATVNGKPKIYARDLRSGVVRFLADGGPCGELPAPIDPARRRVAYCSGVGSHNSIWTLDATTGRRTFIRRQYYFTPVGWRANGDLLLLRYAAARRGDSPSELFEVQGKTMMSLYRAAHTITDVTVMRDDVFAFRWYDHTVSCTACGMQLALVRVSGGRGTILAHTPGWAQPIVAFDGGRALLYAREAGGAPPRGYVLESFRARGDGFVSEPVAAPAHFAVGAALGPDSLIATAGTEEEAGATGTSSGIYVYDTRNWRVHRIADGGFGPVAWTADGSVVHQGAANEIVVTDLSGNSRIVVRATNARPIAVF